MARRPAGRVCGRCAAAVEADRSARPLPGEPLMVLPKAATKSIGVTRGLTRINYQIAIATKVAPVL